VIRGERAGIGSRQLAIRTSAVIFGAIFVAALGGIVAANGNRAAPPGGSDVLPADSDAAHAESDAPRADSENTCRAEAETLPSRIAREGSVGIPPTRGWDLDHLGNRLFDRNRIPAAFACFDASVKAMRAEEDRFGEGIALKDRGIAHRYLTHHEAGLEDLTLAEEIIGSLEYGSPAHLSAIENLGMGYVVLGAYERGLALYDRSLALARQYGHRAAVYGGLVRLADAALGLGRPERALEQFDAALGLAGEVDGSTLGSHPEIWPQIGAASALADLGRLDEALQRIERALQFAREDGAPDMLSNVLSRKGVLVARRDSAAGVAIIREALVLQRTIEAHQPWGMLGRFARALRMNGELDSAIENGRRAIELLEGTAPGSAPPEFRPTYVETHQSLYAELAGALLDRAEAAGTSTDRTARTNSDRAASDRAEAFAVIEAGRSLRFADTPADAVARRARCDSRRIAAALGSSRALVEFAFTREGVVTFLLQRDSLDVFRTAEAQRQIADRVAAYVDLLRGNDERAAAPVGACLSASLVSPWLPHLGAGVREIVIVPTGVLNLLPFEYLPTGGGAGEAASNSETPALIERAAVSYLPAASLLASSAGTDEPTSGAASLRTARASQPADILFVLGGGPGGLRSQASDGAFSGRDRWLETLFEEEGFDVPLAAIVPLPGASREVESLARYAGKDGLVLRGSAASRAALARLDLGRFEILHFATHGFVSDRTPERSALLIGSGPTAGSPPDADAPLWGGAWLQARDISHWRLGADLVVLSACRTAAGRILTGEGTQSLARAFLDAGARGVIASLWVADDAKTVRLMDVLYAGMASGKTPVEALRSAKRLTARDGTVPMASRASFVFIGESGREIRLRDRASSSLWPWALAAAALATAFVAAIVRRTS